MKKQKPKWKCDDCGEKFDTKRELIEHLEDHLSEAEYTGLICDDQLKKLRAKN